MAKRSVLRLGKVKAPDVVSGGVRKPRPRKQSRGKEKGVMEIIVILLMVVFGIAFGIKLIAILGEFVYKVAPGVIMFALLLLAFLATR